MSHIVVRGTWKRGEGGEKEEEGIGDLLSGISSDPVRHIGSDPFLEARPLQAKLQLVPTQRRLRCSLRAKWRHSSRFSLLHGRQKRSAHGLVVKIREHQRSLLLGKALETQRAGANPFSHSTMHSWLGGETRLHGPRGRRRYATAPHQDAPLDTPVHMRGGLCESHLLGARRLQAISIFVQGSHI